MSRTEILTRMHSLTTDSFFDGKLRIKQYAGGYRFSIDAVLLADHARPRAGDRLLDLGTGCGIVPLILAYRHPDIRVYGIEIQDELADLAVSNIHRNHMQDRITVLRRDLRSLNPDMIGGPVDLIVCNPPYRQPNSGRINPDQQRAVARHELTVNLIEVLQAVRRMLRSAGRLVIIYTAERIAELLSQMRSDGIEPKYMRTIHSHLQEEAKLILVDGVMGARPGVKIGAPLIVYDAKRQYSAEVQRMFEP